MSRGLLVAALGPIVAALVLLGACGSRGGDAPEPIVYAPEQPTSAPSGEPSRAATPPGSAASPPLVVSADACGTDADCVPAVCCHAAACVGRASAPSCGDAMCTQDCRFGTLDCGGACLCRDGHCAARLSEPPAGLRPQSHDGESGAAGLSGS